MKKTQKLKTLVLKELDGLKALLPLEVRKAVVFENLDFTQEESCWYGSWFGNSFSPMCAYTKNLITAPYSYHVDEYKRCRMKKFHIDELHGIEHPLSPLEFYSANCSDEENKAIYEYLLEETNKISL